MPRISQAFLDSVFFLFGTDPASGTRKGPGGSGFLVQFPSEKLQGLSHIYGISNRHVVQNYPDLRINTRSGSSRVLEFDPTDWKWSHDEDLCAVDVTDCLNIGNDGDAVSFVPVGDFLREDDNGRTIGVGNPTIMLGFLADHVVFSTNVPVGRFGNIAGMADQNTPIKLSNSDQFARPAFLNDMRSRTGFSGSPVWAWHNPYDDMEHEPVQFALIGGSVHSARKSAIRLLGIHRGQFWEKTSVVSAESVQISAGNEIEIASSMTVVIPAWEIARLLGGEIFSSRREQRDQRSDRIDASAEIQRLQRKQDN